MIELIAVAPDEARVAEQAGADRIELVSALSEGGLTPGIGLVRQTVAAVRIPVNVMVRPHSRGFVYSQADLAVMREEIGAIRAAGANGVVFGALDGEGRVELRVLEALLGCAEGLEVTFHRAIDASRDPVAAARTLSGYPVRTILTSGGPGPIGEHVDVLRRMREAAGHVRIMAGGGLTLANAPGLLQAAGLPDAHFGTAVRKANAVDRDIDPELVRELVKRLK
jgi:copper homeostasis protein